MMDNDFRVSEGLAAALVVSEAEVAAWEAGSVRIPTRKREWIEYLLACREWNAGIAASGLPACEWLETHAGRLPQAAGSSAILSLTRELDAHAGRCDTCRARATWAEANLPPLPTPPSTRIFGPFARGVSRLPAWARPAAWGALGLAVLTAVRVVVTLPRILHSPLQALGVVLLAGAAGSVGGLTYSAVRPVLRPLGAPGNYLTGILCTVAYAGAIPVIAAVTGAPMIADATDFSIFVLVSVLFGTLVGKMIHEHTPTG
jgi:hypothetical protein